MTTEEPYAVPDGEIPLIGTSAIYKDGPERLSIIFNINLSPLTNEIVGETHWDFYSECQSVENGLLVTGLRVDWLDNDLPDDPMGFIIEQLAGLYSKKEVTISKLSEHHQDKFKTMIKEVLEVIGNTDKDNINCNLRNDLYSFAQNRIYLRSYN